MVKCNQEEFRLKDRELEKETTSSICSDQISIYKQKIDSMFGDRRSCTSSNPNNDVSSCDHLKNRLLFRNGNIVNVEKPKSGSTNSYNEINNAVQARIEKMFADIVARNAEGRRTHVSKSSNSAARSDTSSQISGSISKALAVSQCLIHANRISLSSMNSQSSCASLNANHKFSVDYLGSVPLADKVTTLQGLQKPLKDLYFEYRSLENQNRKPAPGTLEISGHGLKVHHFGGEDKGELEQLNPFPTIAVWAAVKFVCKKELKPNGQMELRYAFLPLIADPDSQEKTTLYNPLTTKEATLANGNHSPMFACVMRKIGVSKQLECHGFVCACSEDAIVIAANLYQALIANMKIRRGIETSPDSLVVVHDSDSTTSNVRRDKPNSVAAKKSDASNSYGGKGRNTSRASAPSVTSSALRRSASKCSQKDIRQSRKSPLPVRPPRRKKTPSQNGDILSRSASEEVLDNPAGEVEPPRSRILTRSGSDPHNFIRTSRSNSSCSRRGRVRRTVSDRNTPSVVYESGDILTKVAIPRSHSFLNSPKTKCGLNELFQEFRIQEGLTNIDDILSQIINPNGMSFNELKPIYKEFLLKLAVTLTKDELYQRSKNIMRRQNRRKKGPGRVLAKSTSSLMTVESETGGLKRVFRRSFSKLKVKPSSSFEFSSVLFPTRVNGNSCCDKPYSSSTSSCSSSKINSSRRIGLCSQSKRSRNGRYQNPPKPRVTRGSFRDANKADFGLGISTSDGCSDSDFCSVNKPHCENVSNIPSGSPSPTGYKSGFVRNSQHHPLILASMTSRRGTHTGRSSSGYVSCSECSYDSESCTSEKCYCSLPRYIRQHQSGITRSCEPTLIDKCKRRGIQDFSSCGCDTDSCTESDKCYCSYQKQQIGKSLNRIPDESDSSDSTLVGSKFRAPLYMKNQINKLSQMRQKGLAGSDSSLSRADSPLTAWEKNEKKYGFDPEPVYKYSKNTSQQHRSYQHGRGKAMAPQPPKTKNSTSSGGLDLPWKKKSQSNHEKKMDVYDNGSRVVRRAGTTSLCGGIPGSVGLFRKTESPPFRSYSSDNLALDYDLFLERNGSERSRKFDSSSTTSERSAQSLPYEDSEGKLVRSASRRKVLLVSARDPCGKVIYMGASSSSQEKNHMEKAAQEALSVKKSAEIAALFSDVKLNQTTNIIEHSSPSNDTDTVSNQDSKGTEGEAFYNTLEPPGQQSSGNNNHYTECNLENSLGYLP